MDHQETPWFEVMTFNSSFAGKKTKANKKTVEVLQTKWGLLTH